MIICYGAIKFLQALWMLLRIPFVLFESEKKMDQMLFTQWEKNDDYNKFEKRIEDINFYKLKSLKTNCKSVKSSF
jgi:hypothetical protein